MSGFHHASNLLHDIAMHIGQAEVADLEAEGELCVVEAQQLHDRGEQVVDVNPAASATGS